MVRWQISAILGGAATVAIAAAALIADTSTIKQDLIARTAQVLAGEATSWASVEIVGRDAYLSGAAPSEDLRALVVARLQRVFGIRRVDDSAATLLADELIRGRYGLGARLGDEHQPWYLYALNVVDTAPRGPVIMRFRFHVSSVPSVCRLALGQSSARHTARKTMSASAKRCIRRC